MSTDMDASQWAEFIEAVLVRLDLRQEPSSVQESLCEAIANLFGVSAGCIALAKDTSSRVQSIITNQSAVGQISGPIHKFHAGQQEHWPAERDKLEAAAGACIVRIDHDDFKYIHYFVLRGASRRDLGVSSTLRIAEALLKSALFVLMRERDVSDSRANKAQFLGVLSQLVQGGEMARGTAFSLLLDACDVHVPSQHSCVWLHESRTKKLCLRATRGLSYGTFQPVIPAGTSITGECLQPYGPRWYLNTRDHVFIHRFQNPDKLAELGVRAMVTLPVRAGASDAEPGVEEPAPVFIVSFFFSDTNALPTMSQLETLQEHLPSLFGVATLAEERKQTRMFQPRATHGRTGRGQLSYDVLLKQLADGLPVSRLLLFAWDIQRSAYRLVSFGQSRSSHDGPSLSAQLRGYTRDSVTTLDPTNQAFHQAAESRVPSVIDDVSHWKPFSSAPVSHQGDRRPIGLGLEGAESAAVAAVSSESGRPLAYLVAVDKLNPTAPMWREPFSTDDLRQMHGFAGRLVPFLARDQRDAGVRAAIAASVHELSNPVRSVADYIEAWLLLKRLPQRNELDDLRSHLDFALLLIRGIQGLDGAGSRRKPRWESCDLDQDVFTFAKSAVKPLCRVRNLRFDNISYQTEMPTSVIETDSDLLRQVMFNLLSNAVKYASRDVNRQLRVNVTLRKEIAEGRIWHVLEVSDDGIGVDPGSEDLIFDQGYRTDSARMVEARGMGIGLPVTKDIVDNLGGAMRLSSPREPTVFEVRLPSRESVPVFTGDVDE